MDKNKTATPHSRHWFLRSSLGLENGCSLTEEGVESQESGIPFHMAQHPLRIAQALWESKFSKGSSGGLHGALKSYLSSLGSHHVASHLFSLTGYEELSLV